MGGQPRLSRRRRWLQCLQTNSHSPPPPRTWRRWYPCRSVPLLAHLHWYVRKEGEGGHATTQHEHYTPTPPPLHSTPQWRVGRASVAVWAGATQPSGSHGGKGGDGAEEAAEVAATAASLMMVVGGALEAAPEEALNTYLAWLAAATPAARRLPPPPRVAALAATLTAALPAIPLHHALGYTRAAKAGCVVPMPPTSARAGAPPRVTVRHVSGTVSCTCGTLSFSLASLPPPVPAVCWPAVARGRPLLVRVTRVCVGAVTNLPSLSTSHPLLTHPPHTHIVRSWCRRSRWQPQKARS